LTVAAVTQIRLRHHLADRFLATTSAAHSLSEPESIAKFTHMPRAKRPLAEADPNASRRASYPKASKTSAGKLRKTADGHILQDYTEERPIQSKRNATRSRPLGAADASVRTQSSNSTSPEQADPTFNSANNSRYRLRLPGSSYSSHADDNVVIGVHKGQNLVDATLPPPNTDYNTKDTSKLRTLLSDRCMSTTGSRTELISRLQKSTFDYDTYSSEQIVELLSKRGLKNTSKAVKIQRLLLNDSLDRDTSNYEDMKLYLEADLSRGALERLAAKQEAILSGEDRSYSTSTWTLGKLGALLKDRKLASSGTKEEMIARLRANDRKKLVKDIQKAEEGSRSTKEQLEVQIGHSIEDTDLMRIESSIDSLDNQLQSQAQLSRPRKPICEYDWRQSHWASRTERELWDICQRRGMPASGPKAALIKWLDTGSAEYEDLYAGSLEMICYRRGIKHRSGEKKVNLIRILEEADEREKNCN